MAAWLSHQAIQSIQAANTLAQEVSHPYSLDLALIFNAYLHQYRRETMAAHDTAKGTMALLAEQASPSLLRPRVRAADAP